MGAIHTTTTTTTKLGVQVKEKKKEKKQMGESLVYKQSLQADKCLDAPEEPYQKTKKKTKLRVLKIKDSSSPTLLFLESKKPVLAFGIGQVTHMEVCCCCVFQGDPMCSQLWVAMWQPQGELGSVSIVLNHVASLYSSHNNNKIIIIKLLKKL